MLVLGEYLRGLIHFGTSEGRRECHLALSMRFYLSWGRVSRVHSGQRKEGKNHGLITQVTG